jgi:hypothetical protein
MEHPRRDAAWLAGGGALLCVVAVSFLWGQLAIDSEYLLALGAVVAAALGLRQFPSQRPDLGLYLLAGTAAVAGAWFGAGAYLGLVPAAAFHPVPLVAALTLSLVGALAVVLGAFGGASDARAARMIYALCAIALLASAALYYQLFTVGFAGDQVARRMVLTLVWLATGLGLIVRGERLQNGGRIFVAAAYAKALFYDTTHLAGGLRITALFVTGALLLGGAWALHRRHEAA